MKSQLLGSEPEYPDTVYKDDIRALVLAHRLNNQMVNVETNAQITGSFAYYYRKLAGLRKVLLAILLLLILFQRPSWCVKMGASIDPTCTIDSEGRTYNLVVTSFVEPRTSFVLSFGIMYFLLMLQALKVHASAKVLSSERLKLVLQAICFLLGLGLSLFEGMGVFSPSDFPSIFKLLFVIVYFKSVMQSFGKIGSMLASSAAILFLLAFVIIIFASLGLALFEGLPVGADTILKGYCFRNFASALETMFLIIFYEMFPDILVETGVYSWVYAGFFAIYAIITSILLLGLTTGVFYYNYKGIYTRTLNRVAAIYPTFTDNIATAMRARFLKPEIADSLTKRFEISLRDNKVEIPTDAAMIRSTYKAKLRRAVLKIKYLNSFKRPAAAQSIRQRYLAIAESFYYRAATFLLALYLCALSVMAVAPGAARGYISCLQTSELVAFIFLIDFLLRAHFSTKLVFWGFANIVECVSNVGVILIAHTLYLMPADYRATELIGSRALYLLWTFCCLLKFFILQRLLMRGIKYKIIVKTVLHIFPLLLDLLSCYIVLVLVYGVISYSALGGAINSDFSFAYREATGSAYGYTFSYNDLPSAMLSFAVTNIASSFTATFYPGLVAAQEKGAGPGALLFLKLFFYSYVVISELIVINIIVGFIIDFLNIYQENNAAQRIKENVIGKKQDFVDVMLDNKEFGEINPDEFDEEGFPVERDESKKGAVENLVEEAGSEALSNEFDSEVSADQQDPGA